jgi:hypothetical protein
LDTKLTSDVAESAAVTELLKQGFRVLRPIGDRLPYDLAIDDGGLLIRIQVKSAWYDRAKRLYTVDARRTKTNRRRMVRSLYAPSDFDFAILYLPDRNVFYVMPVNVFTGYGSGISLVETVKRQRRPRSDAYRERWDLLSGWAARHGNGRVTPVKVGEAAVVTPSQAPDALLRKAKHRGKV